MTMTGGKKRKAAELGSEYSIEAAHRTYGHRIEGALVTRKTRRSNAKRRKRRLRAGFQWNHLLPEVGPDPQFVETTSAATIIEATIHTIHSKLVALGQLKRADFLVRNHPLVRSLAEKDDDTELVDAALELALPSAASAAEVPAADDTSQSAGWGELIEQTKKKKKVLASEPKPAAQPLWQPPTGEEKPPWEVDTTARSDERWMIKTLYKGLKQCGICPSVVVMEGFQSKKVGTLAQSLADKCACSVAAALEPPEEAGALAVPEKSSAMSTIQVKRAKERERKTWERNAGQGSQSAQSVTAPRYVDHMLTNCDPLPEEADHCATTQPRTLVVPLYRPLGWLVHPRGGLQRFTCHYCQHQCRPQCQQRLEAPGFAQCAAGIASHVFCDTCVEKLGSTSGIGFQWLLKHPEQWLCPVTRTPCQGYT